MATNYIRELGRELEERLAAIDALWRGSDWSAAERARAEIVAFVKAKALESYRNGLNATTLRVDKAAQKLERPVRAS
jgi:hypothetical protein